MADRIESLRALLAQAPTDSRMLHMLANELGNAGRADEALIEYGKLVNSDPDYVPGYFQAGRLAERLGKLDDARAWYEKGVTTARRTGDKHAEREILDAIALL